MTELEYRTAFDELLKTESFTVADNAFYKKLDKLTADAKDMIKNNHDDLISENGTTYYISNNGDDAADGKSPETAWKTLEKVNTFVFNAGDAAVFERGGTWRGYIAAQNGVIYSAYGSGAKPRILAAFDGTECEWVKTEFENIWRYEKIFDSDDIPCIFFEGESCAVKKDSFAGLEKDLDFMYNSDWSLEEASDNKIYLYSKSHPKERFSQINISMYKKVVEPDNRSRPHDITLKNLELLYGRGAFMATNSRNLKMSYCICGMSGGHFISRQNHHRMGGGAGGWCICDGFYFDHCYFYQQFDSGVTPQYHWNEGKEEAVFKDFITTDCIFETTEYTLEYFNTQLNFKNNGFVNMVFSYNLCLKGGKGFGDKTDKSAYIKSWGHENNCKSCEISHNIFDRAAALSLEIIGHEPDMRGENISYGAIPKLSHNIYIEPKAKIWANINHIMYRFKPSCKITLEKLGVDQNSTYIYSE